MLRHGLWINLLQQLQGNLLLRVLQVWELLFENSPVSNLLHKPLIRLTLAQLEDRREGLDTALIPSQQLKHLVLFCGQLLLQLHQSLLFLNGRLCLGFAFGFLFFFTRFEA